MFAPADYAFALPPELIAQEPPERRDASRLLHVTDPLADLQFPNVVGLLPEDAVVVVNDTRVIPARVLGKKGTGGAVEFLFLEPDAHPAPEGTTAWRCLAKARRALRPGQVVEIGEVRPAREGTLPSSGAEGRRGFIEILTERAADGSIVVAAPGNGLDFLDVHGHIPLPHYIARADRADDRERYQTMFAANPGAVAAPTAGLHLTPAIVDAMRARGMTVAPVTLHVGWGTFEPIRVDDVRAHQMHRERYAIPEATQALVASGRPVVAIGTTALRALESAALKGPSGATDLFIYPGSGHVWRAVDHLVTNFHLPESTLLMLVCAFAGTERIMAAYRHAVAHRYRFFSYGDAMLLHRQ